MRQTNLTWQVRKDKKKRQGKKNNERGTLARICCTTLSRYSLMVSSGKMSFHFPPCTPHFRSCNYSWLFGRLPFHPVSSFNGRFSPPSSSSSSTALPHAFSNAVAASEDPCSVGAASSSSLSAMVGGLSGSTSSDSVLAPGAGASRLKFEL